MSKFMPSALMGLVIFTGILYACWSEGVFPADGTGQFQKLIDCQEQQR